MITGINESRTLTKHISCKCQCNFDRKKCSSNQKWNSNKCWYECKNPKKHCLCKKKKIIIIFGILLHVVTKIVNM